MAKIYGTCSVCANYGQIYRNQSVDGYFEHVCEKCFMPKVEVDPKSKLGYTIRKDINCDEEFEFWLNVDWKNQRGEININADLKIICFDSEQSYPQDVQGSILPPTSSVYLKNHKIGDLAWFQPMNQSLGWNLSQNLDWMPVGIGFLSNYGWSGEYEKTRERARLLIKQEKFSNILHSRIQSLHHESAEVGLVGLMPTTWAEISDFAQTDLRHLLVSEGARIGSEDKSSLKSERKTVFFDTESLRVPLVMFAATMLLEYLHFEDMYMNESGNRT